MYLSYILGKYFLTKFKNKIKKLHYKEKSADFEKVFKSFDSEVGFKTKQTLKIYKIDEILQDDNYYDQS